MALVPLLDHRAAGMREPPPAFVAELRRRFGAGHDVVWSDQIQRWLIISPSMHGKPTAQVFGWFHDPNCSTWNEAKQRFDFKPIEREANGLPPFRDLDADAQRDILVSMEETSVVGRQGAGSWEKHMKAKQAHNDALGAKRRRQMAEDYATVIRECDLRRPWLVTDHRRRPGLKKLQHWG